MFLLFLCCPVVRKYKKQGWSNIRLVKNAVLRQHTAVFHGPDSSYLLSKTAESQLTRGEIWAEFAQLSFIPLHATLVTLSLAKMIQLSGIFVLGYYFTEKRLIKN
jgi:hypothetical protein